MPVELVLSHCIIFSCELSVAGSEVCTSEATSFTCPVFIKKYDGCGFFNRKDQLEKGIILDNEPKSVMSLM